MEVTNFMGLEIKVRAFFFMAEPRVIEPAAERVTDLSIIVTRGERRAEEMKADRTSAESRERRGGFD